MKNINFVDFDCLPPFFIETVFIDNFKNFGLMKNSSCLECWDNLVRLSLTPGLLNTRHLNLLFQKILNLTSSIDFYVDQLLPLFESVTILNLKNQRIHDNSGIIECISQLTNLKTLNISSNLISEIGIEKMLLRQCSTIH